MAAHDVELFAIEYFGRSEFGWGARTRQAAVAQFMKDFAAIAMFFYERRVVVNAVELPVFCDDLGLATCVDLVVEMDAKAYTDKTEHKDRERVKAIINLKSGRNITDTHALQLVGERDMFNSLFGAMIGRIDRVFILAPKDWTKEPSYTISEQTCEVATKRFYLMLEQARITGTMDLPHSQVQLFSGNFEMGADPRRILTGRAFMEYFMQESNKPKEV
jgi:hypothetical protein